MLKENTFTENATYMQNLVGELARKVTRILKGGHSKAREKYLSKNKL